MRARSLIPCAATFCVVAFAVAGGGSDPALGTWVGTANISQASYTNGVPTDGTVGTQSWSTAFLPSHAATIAESPGTWTKDGKKYSVDGSKGLQLEVAGQSGDPHAKGKLKEKKVTIDPALGMSGQLVESFQYHAGADLFKLKATGIFACTKQ